MWQCVAYTPAWNRCGMGHKSGSVHCSMSKAPCSTRPHLPYSLCCSAVWLPASPFTHTHHGCCGFRYIMDAMGDEEVRQHVKILPQCQLQPFADTELAMWSHYWPGDFMVHFAGSFDFIDRFQAYAAASHPTASLYVSCHLSQSLLPIAQPQPRPTTTPWQSGAVEHACVHAHSTVPSECRLRSCGLVPGKRQCASYVLRLALHSSLAASHTLCRLLLPQTPARFEWEISSSSKHCVAAPVLCLCFNVYKIVRTCRSFDYIFTLKNPF